MSGRQVSVWHLKFARDIKNACIENIRNHQPRLRAQFAVADLLENRAAITALARSENSQPQFFHAPALRLAFSSSPDVECPASSGRIMTSDPIRFSTARSSLCKLSSV